MTPKIFLAVRQNPVAIRSCQGRVEIGVGMLSMLLFLFRLSTALLCRNLFHHLGQSSSGDKVVTPNTDMGARSLEFTSSAVRTPNTSRGRTHHSRPTVGLERSVLHNEWEEAWYCNVCHPLMLYSCCLVL